MRRHAKATVAALALLVALVLAVASASATAPTVTINSPTAVETTKAHLSGEVTVPAEGPETWWGFEYAIEGTEAWSGFPYSGTVAVGETQLVPTDLTGLKANKKYEARLVGENFSDPRAESAVVKFKTDPVPVDPTLTLNPATDVSYTTAKVSGAVDPEGGNQESGGAYVPIHWDLELRDFTEEGVFSPVASGDINSGEGAESTDPIDVGPAELSGLTPGHTYHYYLLTTFAGQQVASAGSSGEFTTLAVTPPAVSIEPASAIAGTSAHFAGTVEVTNSNEAFDASCRFEYLSQADFEAAGNAFPAEGAPSLDCAPATVTGTEPQPVSVSADPTDLQPHTTYHLRLRAENSGGADAAEAASAFTTLALAPAILHTSVSDVGATQATLNASIKPGGDPTSYRFQYMTQAAYEAAGNSFTGATQTPSSSLALGAADNAAHPASATLTGLAPDTAYRYRALATNSIGTTEGDGHERVLHTYAPPSEEADACPNAAIRAQQRSAYLPDCRAYEQVSPSEKSGADVLVDTTFVRAALDGDAVSFASMISFGDSQGALVMAEYMGVRSASGWAVHGITPLQEPLTLLESAGTLRPRYAGEFSPDLSKGLYLANSALTDDPNVAGVSSLYLRDDLLSPGAGHYRLVSAATTPQTGGADRLPLAATASEDFRHVLFESQRNLTDDAIAAGLDPTLPKVYKWDDGVVRLVGILPASEGGGPAATSLAGEGAAFNNSARALSADGSRVIFTVPDTGCSGAVCGALYVRDDQGTSATVDDETVQVGVSERTDCADDPLGCSGAPAPDPGGAGRPVSFWGATTDARTIYLTSAEQLTDDDHNPFVDLYRYDADAAAGHQLSRLSQDTEPADGDGATVDGVIGASADGSYVYFVAGGDQHNQLVAGGPTGSTGGPLGAARIYVWHDGSVHYVGGVNQSTELTRMLGLQSWFSETTQARVTPNGTHLIFMSQGTDELVGYDHGDTCSPWAPTTDCSEIYVYDATANGGAGQMACASCNPTGQKGSADATIITRFAFGGSKQTSHLNRSVSDDGRYVFFTTAEALVAEDTNGQSDAYSYDTTTGTPHLLSSGTDPSPSFFLEASGDGSDAFIATREQLVSSDNDEAVDLYDARALGGFPEPLPAPAPCSDDACQGPQSAAPPASAPQSNRLSGAGNAKPPKRCRGNRHRVRRGGKVRCVKKGAKGDKGAKGNRANHNRRAGA